MSAPVILIAVPHKTSCAVVGKGFAVRQALKKQGCRYLRDGVQRLPFAFCTRIVVAFLVFLMTFHIWQKSVASILSSVSEIFALWQFRYLGPRSRRLDRGLACDQGMVPPPRRTVRYVRLPACFFFLDIVFHFAFPFEKNNNPIKKKIQP